MPPYIPLYLKKARRKAELAFRAYIRVCSAYEETEDPVLLKTIEELDRKCIKADQAKDDAWDRWQIEQVNILPRKENHATTQIQ